MTDVIDILDDTKSTDAWYDPKKDFQGLMPEGDYKAHVSSLSVKKNIVVKGKHLSDIYTVSFTIAEDNSDAEFETENGDKVSGSAFVGREVYSKGFFRFKKPNKAQYPQLSESMGSNKSYMELIDSLGVTVEESEGRYYLPELDESDVMGKPSIVRVFHDGWTDREGNERTSAKVSMLFEWADGKEKEEDLPF